LPCPIQESREPSRDCGIHLPRWNKT
jgi:hypothetical protein